MLIKQVGRHTWTFVISIRENKTTRENHHIRMSVWQKKKKLKNETAIRETHHSISHRKSRLNFVYAIGVGGTQKNCRGISNLQTTTVRANHLFIVDHLDVMSEKDFPSVIPINYIVLKCLVELEFEIREVVLCCWEPDWDICTLIYKGGFMKIETWIHVSSDFESWNFIGEKPTEYNYFTILRFLFCRA